MSLTAQYRVIASTDDDFAFRAADNRDYTVTPQEMVEIGLKALAHVDAHYWR